MRFPPALRGLYKTRVRAPFLPVAKWIARHRLPIGASLAAVLAVLGVTYALLPAPTAQGALKGHKVEIYRNAHFQVVFDQNMNRASVEKAFKLTPPAKGSFSWAENVLTYRPDQVLDKGSTYELEIGDGARNVFGKELKDAFRQTFYVLDYPEVAVVAPADQSEIRQAQTLTVLFDHPIRVLTDKLAVPELLKIEPAVKGKYNWLGTSGFEFIPEKGWPAATDFTVTVPKGTKTADGGSTVSDYTWKFATPRLTLNSGGLYRQITQHPPKDPVVLNFNYPMDPAVVKNAITIEDVTASTTLATDQFTFENGKDNKRTVLIRKKDTFRLGATYWFTIPEGFTGGIGPKGLVNRDFMLVTTDDNFFKFLSSEPGDGSTKDIGYSVSLYFNNPVDEKTVAKNLRISPALKDMEATVEHYGGESERRIYINGKLEPSTTYTITVSQGLSDVYGQKLDALKNLTVTTNPYRPSAEISSYASYGLLASHLPRLYQVRTMNLTKPVTAVVCSGTFEQYLKDESFDCGIKGEKTFDTTNPLNKYKIIDLDLDDLAGRKLPNGYYSLDIDLPDIDYEWQRQQHRVVLVSDTALTLKRDHANKVLVWATDMQSGEVVPNLNVEAYVGNSGEQGNWKLAVKGTTDNQGVVILDAGKDSKDSQIFVRAEGGGHLGVAGTSWDDGISPWNYGLDVNYQRTLAHHIGYVYTDRRIYRPDQLVYFKAVVRRDVDAALAVPAAKEADVLIVDPQGRKVLTKKFPLSSYGTLNGSFQLDPSMDLGTYSIYVSLDEDAYERQNIVGSFDVREYRRPDFKVEATTPQDALSGQKIDLGVHAEYYFGGALAGGKAEYTITRNALYFQPMEGEWYSYSTGEDYDCYWYCRVESNFENVASGEVTLDQNGNATISIPANLTDYKSSANYYVTVTVTDVNSRQVSFNADFPVHKGEFYMGIRANYDKGWGGPTADFDVVSVNLDGSRRSGVPSTVKLYKRTWVSVKKEQTGGSFWDYEKKDELVDTKSVTTNNEGKGSVTFAPPQDGEHVAVVEARDSRGNLVSASAYRYVYRGEGGTFRVSDDHQMKVIQNKAEYKPGDKASLVVQTPYQQTKALVTIERETVKEYRVVDIGSAMRTVEIPITDESTPNIYVSVLAMQGGGEKGVPQFKLGYADLRVDTSKKVLDLKITTDKSVYKPGEKVTLTVETKKNDGAGVSAEVSVAVVDEKVVALLGSIDKNILGRFWFQRLIGVTTAQSLTQVVEKKFFATEGGAGDGKGDAGKVPAVRGNFLDTAYWKADLTTGADGRGTVSFDLPDNLTSWQILAIGATKDTVVGAGETKIVTRKDLMVEPLVPRILRLNDTAVIGATVFNQTDAGFGAEVSIEVEGLTIDGGAKRTVMVGPKGRLPVTWTVHVPVKSTGAKITVRVKGAGLEDGFVVPIPVLPYSVPETVTASGDLVNTATEKIEAPEDILPTMGELNISVAPNVGNGLAGGLDYLLNYEYGCTEQTTSAYLAALAYEQLVKQKITKGDAGLLARAKDKIEGGIKKIVPMQKPDGGFGLWMDSDKSDPYHTAYVYWGLTQAQKAGYAVDQAVMDATDKYLRGALADKGWRDWWWGYYGVNENLKSQVLFMLSERDANGLAGYASELYDARAKLTAFGKAFLAMAIGNIDPGVSSARVATLLGDIRNKVVYLDPTRAYVGEDKGYDEYMSTDLRSTGLYLQALLRLDPNNKDVGALVRYMMGEKHDGYWETTQNTAMTMLALAEYAKANPVDTAPLDVSVFINNDPKAPLLFPEGDVSLEQSMKLPLSEVLKRDVTEIGLEKESDKRYFYDISMKTYRQIDDIAPFENGFTVTSEYYATDDKNFERPLSSAKVGDNVRVRLRILVPKRHKYVAVEDHLPAGLEAIDFQLKTSPQDISGEQKQCVPSYWGGEPECFSEGDWGWSWWWENVWKHIELRDDRVFLFSESLQAGVYEYTFMAQAVTPGEFRVPPARAYEFYNPNANGHNEGKVFKVIAR